MYIYKDFLQPLLAKHNTIAALKNNFKRTWPKSNDGLLYMYSKPIWFGGSLVTDRDTDRFKAKLGAKDEDITDQDLGDIDKIAYVWKGAPQYTDEMPVSTLISGYLDAMEYGTEFEVTVEYKGYQRYKGVDYTVEGFKEEFFANPSSFILPYVEDSLSGIGGNPRKPRITKPTKASIAKASTRVSSTMTGGVFAPLDSTGELFTLIGVITKYSIAPRSGTTTDQMPTLILKYKRTYIPMSTLLSTSQYAAIYKYASYIDPIHKYLLEIVREEGGVEDTKTMSFTLDSSSRVLLLDFYHSIYPNNGEPFEWLYDEPYLKVSYFESLSNREFVEFLSKQLGIRVWYKGPTAWEQVAAVAIVVVSLVVTVLVTIFTYGAGASVAGAIASGLAGGALTGVGGNYLMATYAGPSAAHQIRQVGWATQVLSTGSSIMAFGMGISALAEISKQAIYKSVLAVANVLAQTYNFINMFSSTNKSVGAKVAETKTKEESYDNTSATYALFDTGSVYETTDAIDAWYESMYDVTKEHVIGRKI